MKKSMGNVHCIHSYRTSMLLGSSVKMKVASAHTKQGFSPKQKKPLPNEKEIEARMALPAQKRLAGLAKMSVREVKQKYPYLVDSCRVRLFFFMKCTLRQ